MTRYHSDGDNILEKDDYFDKSYYKMRKLFNPNPTIQG